jgi:hypothetical protein
VVYQRVSYAENPKGPSRIPYPTSREESEKQIRAFLSINLRLLADFHDLKI